MTADILREKFLVFFKARKHKIIDSDSLVPKDDPTVLFTPAGMNQFKSEFMGFDSGFKRAATAQRCLRTDDLDKVGKTSVHHTFFEMLGNFSFGDYFKKEAISWAWEFLTEELKISADKLRVSVYQDDNEAYGIWKDEVKIPEDKIIRLGDKDNFWPAEAKAKGPNGPCGPCSEIFYDFGKEAGCKKQDCTPACSCGRFAEIWNLVFTQFNRKPDGSLEPLPNKNIDTGMGLERLAAVMQGVKSNFETELFQPIIKEIINSVPRSPNVKIIYAIADHIRAVTFSIFDGILPSNEGRGYVIRRIIRKSILHLNSLGIKEPFLYRLVAIVVEIMRKSYPELAIQREKIARIVLAEEKNFINALGSREELFKSKFTEFIEKPNPETVGSIAFLLHDTYGIPLELTKEWLDKHKISFSGIVFAQAMEEQKARSKLGSAMKGDVFSPQGVDLKVKESKFVGYEDYIAKAKVLMILRDGREVKKAAAGEEVNPVRSGAPCRGTSNGVNIILDATPFYAESGGQIGDSGQLMKGKNIFQVSDTRKIGKVIAHIGKIKSGAFKTGDLLQAKVDSDRRMAIARNHTATHLLQAALREVLGVHVQQQGSLVEAESLRFDFTHFKGLDQEQLEKVEELVNQFVMANYPLEVQQMELAQAKKTGALAFFSEKYSGKVRVVNIGDVSKEFCGGTHLSSTGQIGYFKIIQEGSAASGVRRIQAVCGRDAYKLIKEEEGLLEAIGVKLNTTRPNLLKTLENNLTRMKMLEKSVNQQKLSNVKGSLEDIIKQAEVINGVKLIMARLENLDMDLLRKNVDMLKAETGSAVIALGSGKDNKAFLVIGVTADLCAKGLDAGGLIRQVAETIGGSGGGRGDFAQAGGIHPENFALAFDKLRDIIIKQL